MESDMKSRTETNMRKLIVLCLLVLAVLIFTSTVMADTPEYIRIGLTRQFSGRETIQIGNTSISAGRMEGGRFTPLISLQSASGFTARVRDGHVALYSGNQQVYLFTGGGAQIVDSTGGVVQLGNYSYRGVIEFRVASNRLTAINVLCVEEYLYGVLPAEMGFYFHHNALKAQAIASRTFMIYRTNEGRHSGLGFDLCDDIHCQSYRGTGREHENTSRAIRETAGQMLFYNDAVVLAVYFASSGGSTANSESVWVQARPYLRGVREFYEHMPIEWSRSFTWAQVNTSLVSAGANIGTATGMAITGVATYGRVQEVTIYGTAGQWVLRGEAVRTFFAPAGGTLMSRNFYIAEARPNAPVVAVSNGTTDTSGSLTSFQWRDAAGTIGPVHDVYVFDGTITTRITQTPSRATGGTGVTLHGRGWGHGVGMSQRGAHGMALAGFSHLEILKHYYTGVEIR